MMSPAMRNRDYMQMCWVVPDLDAAIGHWLRTTGAGPFFVFDDLHFDDGVYRGAPSDVQPCRAAIGQHGDMQIELVEPGVHRTEPLVVQPREVLDLDAEGLHGDLELDERALGRPYRLFQAVLRSSLLFFLPAVRVRHAPRLRGGARDAPTLPARRAPISPLAPRTPVPEVVNMSNSPPWYAVSCLP